MEAWTCSAVEGVGEETTKCRTVSMDDAVAIDRSCGVVALVLKYL